MASTLSCQSCSKAFTDPRLLPCLHYFCKSCLEPLYSEDEGTITCPTCKKISSCKPPEELPRHLRVEKDSLCSNIQESPEETVTLCGSCEENNKAEAFCEDCSTPICSDCISSHKKLRAVKKHSVVSLTLSQPMSQEYVSCILHPDEAIKYYCSTCSCLVCSECLFAHKEHDSSRIDNVEMLTKEKDELQVVLPELEEAITPIVKTAENICEIVKRIQANKERAKGEIKVAFKQIIDAVENRQLELIQECDNSAEAKTTMLEKQKEGLDKMSTSLQLALDSGRVACTEYTNAEVLAVKGTILKTSNEFLQEARSIDLQPVNNSSLSLVVDNLGVIVSVASLGSIVMGFPYPKLCTLTNINPKLAIGVAKGCKCIVTLQTRDENGLELTEGTAKVMAKVTDKSSRSDVSECTISNHENGRYEISFDNPIEGQYLLNIAIDDTIIGNSPFTINVRDYTTIETPVFSTTIKGSPAYIGMGPDNQQYITFNGGSVQVFDTIGKKVKDISQAKLGNKPLRGIAVDKQKGVMFVATAGTHQVIKTNLDGEVMAYVGSKGTGKLEFYYPMGVCLTRDGLLLVAEDTNKRIQVLQSDLSFVRFIPCLSNVYGVSVDGKGNIHAAVTDRVQVFSITGEKITEYGQGVLVRAGDIAFMGIDSCRDSPYSFVTDHVTEGKVYMFYWSDNAVVHSFPMGRRPLGLVIEQEGAIIVGDWNDKKLHRF